MIDIIKSSCSTVSTRFTWMTVCFYYTPSGEVANLLFEPVSTACTYSPTGDGAWNYGCALGVDSADLLHNRDGWSFKERDCAPSCFSSDFETGSGGVLQARLNSSGAGRTSLSMRAIVPDDSDLDLDTTTATMEAVLAPSFGGDLLLDGAGAPALPLELTEAFGHGRDGLTLTTPRGSGGPVEKLQIVGAGNDPGLLLRLTVFGVHLGEVACSSGHTADLTSRIVLTDADGTVTGLNLVRPWDCRVTGKGKNVRLSISPSR